MPKTGTSSIQETLYFGLQDPQFHYYSAGEISGSRVLRTLTAERKVADFFWGARGGDPAFMERKRREYERRLERCLKRVRESGRHLILSGESGWVLTVSEATRLRDLLQAGGFEVEVVVYVRPWKEMLESSIQQRARGFSIFGSPTPLPLFPDAARHFRYRDYLETLDTVFGRERVRARKFEVKSFPGGCVVRDFCQQVGVAIDERCIRRVNESLSLEAVRLLESYRRFGNREGTTGFWRYWQHSWLVQRLQTLGGPKVRVHSSLAESLLSPLLEQRSWLEERLGASLAEDFRNHDEDDCLRVDEDLYRFREESLRWLAKQTGGPMPRGWGEESARQVGALMHRLRHRLPPRPIMAQSFRKGVHRVWNATVKGR